MIALVADRAGVDARHSHRLKGCSSSSAGCTSRRAELGTPTSGQRAPLSVQVEDVCKSQRAAGAVTSGARTQGNGHIPSEWSRPPRRRRSTASRPGPACRSASAGWARDGVAACCTRVAGAHTATDAVDRLGDQLPRRVIDVPDGQRAADLFRTPPQRQQLLHPGTYRRVTIDPACPVAGASLGCASMRSEWPVATR